MLKILLTLPLVAVAAPALAPDLFLETAHTVVNALAVLTPPMFVLGTGLQLFRRSGV
ncbi:MAG: hypothetical protein R2724_29045 [Bryobacterales bacterium]